MSEEHDVAAWGAWLQNVARVRTSTLDQYLAVMTQFVTWTRLVADVTDWDEITPEIIESFIVRPRARVDVPSVATQKRDRVVVAQFYKWARQKGIASTDPCFDVPRPKGTNRKPKAIADHVWVKFWSSNLPADDRVWLGLGTFAGLRRREIVSIAPEQVNAERGLIFGLSRKGGNEDVVEYAEMARIIHERLPHLLPDLDTWLAQVAALARFRAGERCLITMDAPATALTQLRSSFTDPLLPDPAVINKQLVRLLKYAGMDERTFSPHAMRHTAATNLLRAGLPIEVVADCLGHSETATTMRYVKTAGRLSEWRGRLS